jgi:hypothetical protein
MTTHINQLMDNRRYEPQSTLYFDYQKRTGNHRWRASDNRQSINNRTITTKQRRHGKTTHANDHHRIILGIQGFSRTPGVAANQLYSLGSLGEIKRQTYDAISSFSRLKPEDQIERFSIGLFLTFALSKRILSY